MSDAPPISFIVPAHNEEQLIGRTLSALYSALSDIAMASEVIVVDDDSSDATAAIAESLGATVVPVRHRQIARTRNAGARLARGRLLVFVDADTRVSADTVWATIAAVRGGAAGGGATVDFDGRLPWYARLIMPAFRGVMRVGSLAAGCYLFCTRDAFEAVGGFDEALFGGEELAFSRALRRQGRVVILPERVITSGRKLRTHSGWEVLYLMGALLRLGPRALRSREHLGIWYGARREDPGD